MVTKINSDKEDIQYFINTKKRSITINTLNEKEAANISKKIIQMGYIKSLDSVILRESDNSKLIKLIRGKLQIEFFLDPFSKSRKPYRKKKKTLGEIIEENEHKNTIGVVIYCTNTGRFLLQVRSSKVSEPEKIGTWNGIVNYNESPIQFAVRKLYEDSNIQIPKNYLTPAWIDYSDNSTCHYFILIVEKEFEPIINTDNIDSYIWIGPESFSNVDLHIDFKKFLTNDSIIKTLIKNNDSKTHEQYDFKKMIDNFIEE